MRKLLTQLFPHHHHHQLHQILRLQSPTPQQFSNITTTATESLLFSSIPVAKTIFDLTTLSFVAGLLLVSLLSFFFILHLRLRSRRLHHLQHFNSLWTVRLLLVTLAFLWTVNEILRLPFIRRSYLYPFLPTISLKQQADICKLHAVLSFGFLQPGFLITLLFLVNVSIKKSNPSRTWALVSVIVICCPIVLLQILFVYFAPLAALLPKFMHGSSILVTDLFGNKAVLCTYPFFSCVIFGGFVVAYVVAFLLSCWRVMGFVINKGIRQRINVLASTVMVALPLQTVGLCLTLLWDPEDAAYGVVVLFMFLCVALCMTVGEFILVLRPISEALAAGGECCKWGSDSGRRQPVTSGEIEHGTSGSTTINHAL